MADKTINQAISDLEEKIKEKLSAFETELSVENNHNKKVSAELKALSDEHSDLLKIVNTLQDDLNTKLQNNNGLTVADPQKSLGQLFVDSDAFKGMQDKSVNSCRASFENNTILGEDGSPQEPSDTIVPKDYKPGIIAGAFRSLTVLDAIMMGTTSSNTVHYTRELLYTNAAAETIESGTKPQSTLTFEALSVPVRTIAHFIKVSRQVLDDAPLLQSYIDRRMRHGVLNRMEAQILTGNGTTPNISGITTSGNNTPLSTLDTGASDFDALNVAKYQVMAADYMPTSIIMNSVDWGRMERTRTGISNDVSYVGGTGGVVNYINNGQLPMVWGLPVIINNNLTAGTFLCMATQAIMWLQRMGVEVMMFEQDDTNVQENLLTIRAEARGALAIFRPDAIVKGSLPSAP